MTDNMAMAAFESNLRTLAHQDLESYNTCPRYIARMQRHILGWKFSFLRTC